MSYVLRRFFASVLVLSIASIVPLCAAATPAAGTVTGGVTSSDGTPIGSATVTLQAANTRQTQRVDSHGRFTIDDLTAGIYAVSASAGGYNPLARRPIQVRAGATTLIDLTLARSSTSLTTIGSVSTRGAAAISTSSVPTQVISTQDYAARGFTRVSDVLQDTLSATVIRQGSGSPAAPQSVALRGPDPTETLIDIDGHEVNNGNSGDFDLSLLDPADFESVQVVYGIAPSSLIGPSTIGGAINVRTLEPTATPRGLLRLSAGSFNSFGETVQSTGSGGRLGYAVSLHRTTAQNEVANAAIVDSQGDTSVVGSSVAASTALAKLRYGFGKSQGGYAEFTFRDQSAIRDVSAALSSLLLPGQTGPGPSGPVDHSRIRRTLADQTFDGPSYNSFAGSMLLGHNAGYGLDFQVPFGPTGGDGVAKTTALFRHLTSLAAQSVVGPADGVSPYYYNDRDLLSDDTLEIDHSLPNATIALKFRLRSERLDTENPPSTGTVSDQARLRRTETARLFDSSAASTAMSDGFNGLTQTQRSLALRFTYDPTPHFHYTAAAYYSSFSTFGQSLDPRLGLVWTPTATTAFRVSAGTTFQAPQLTELYVSPTLPEPDANGYVDIGNPYLKADRATEYDLGFEQLLGGRMHPTRVAADLYRTNLRTPSQRYIPPTTCAQGEPDPACASFPINIGNAVYTGAELHVDQNVDSRTVVRLGYGINSTYPQNVPPQVQNGTIVPREQFLGVPLHKATLSVDHRLQSGISYNAVLLYEGSYNELNQPPFTTLRAGVDWLFAGLDIGLEATNITDVYNSKFTQTGAGIPYGGAAGPIATDAYALQGPALTVSVTRRF